MEFADARRFLQDLEKLEKETEEKIPPDRRCPVCGQIKIKWRQWSVKGVCRACVRRPDLVRFEDTIFERKLRYALDGSVLRQAREAGKISKSAFADAIGVSRSYLNKLEGGDVETVNEDMRSLILLKLEQMGVEVLDEP